MGEQGSRKAETRRGGRSRRRVWDDLKDPQFSGKSSVSEKETQAVRAHGHSAPHLSACYSGKRTRTQRKELERWRQRNRNKQDMEMYRT